MAAKAGRLTRLKVPGVAVAFTNEACTNSGDNKTYSITNAVKAVWDPQVAIVVKTGGTVTGESYTLNRLTGTITFATVNAGRAAVTVSGSYLPMSVVAEAKQFAASCRAKSAEDNAYGDTDVTRVVTQHECGGSLAEWWIDTYFSGALSAGSPIVVEFSTDGGSTVVFRAWALLSEDSISAAVAGLLEESVSWEGTPDADGRSWAWLV